MTRAAILQAFRSLRPGGTATVIGMIPVGQVIEIPGSELLAEKKLQGSVMGSNRFRIDMPAYVELYVQGKLKLDELLSCSSNRGGVPGDDGHRVHASPS